MLKIISSIATRDMLAELLAKWGSVSGEAAVLESVGGVDAAKRVKAGEVFDAVVLASDAIETLIAGGYLVTGSRIDLVQSDVAVAVKSGASVPDISSEAALRSAIEASPNIGYSTGPSGVALVKLFECWGIAKTLQSRMLQAPPGVPVGALLKQGEVALGFQQLSELMHIEGITVVGLLPEPVRITTIFSAGVCAVSTQREQLAGLLAFMSSSAAGEIKQQHGMREIQF